MLYPVELWVLHWRVNLPSGRWVASGILLFRLGGFNVVGGGGSGGEPGFVRFAPFVAQIFHGLAGVLLPKIGGVFAFAASRVQLRDKLLVVFADDPIEEIGGDTVIRVEFGAGKIALSDFRAF